MTERFRFEPLRLDHADGLADLHLRALPGYFLSQLGRGVVRAFYREFCLHPSDFGVVGRLLETDALAGLVVGTDDVQAHFRGFYRRNAPLVAFRLVRAMLGNAEFRRGAYARWPQAWLALRSLSPLGGGKGPRRGAQGAVHCSLRLLSILIDPALRGSGLALEIQNRFLAQVKEAGHARVGLSVRSDNARAIAFYRKTGWTLTHVSPRGLWFERTV